MTQRAKALSRHDETDAAVARLAGKHRPALHAPRFYAVEDRPNVRAIERGHTYLRT
jgi:hypothetical protein